MAHFLFLRVSVQLKYDGLFDIVSWVIGALFIFSLFFFFLFLKLDNFYLSVFRISALWPSYLLSKSVELFIPVIGLFNSRISILSFLCILRDNWWNVFNQLLWYWDIRAFGLSPATSCTWDILIRLCFTVGFYNKKVVSLSI